MENNFYFFQIFNFDDNDDFPDDWNENNFNDSEWSNGETPFGNKTAHKELNQEQIGNLNILVEMMEKTIGLLEKTFTLKK